jgi:hypothetical protein
VEQRKPRIQTEPATSLSWLAPGTLRFRPSPVATVDRTLAADQSLALIRLLGLSRLASQVIIRFGAWADELHIGNRCSCDNSQVCRRGVPADAHYGIAAKTLLVGPSIGNHHPLVRQGRPGGIGVLVDRSALLVLNDPTLCAQMSGGAIEHFSHRCIRSDVAKRETSPSVWMIGLSPHYRLLMGCKQINASACTGSLLKTHSPRSSQEWGGASMRQGLSST